LKGNDVTQTEEKKREIRKFWGNRPCGVISSPHPVHSAAFFEETRGKRYKFHTDLDKPFMQEAIGFSKYTGKKVLEIGCGIGIDALEWKLAGNTYVGLDYNFPSVQITRGRFEDAGCDGEFTNGDAENLPFPDKSFDIIYSFGVLHHTPGTEKAINEVHRCLRPGGKAIIMLYYKWSAMVFGDIILGRGLYQGNIWKVRSLGELISKYTEWDSQTESSVNPLTKVYSKRQAKKMFRQFGNVEMELHYLWRGHFGPLRRLLPLVPNSVLQNLHRRLGWNLIIKAEK
jgi:ubiquinone/menaquinone biosynthesis C-methylase UbiE